MQASVGRTVSAIAPDAAQAPEVSIKRCVGNACGGMAAPITSATAHHVSHATG
jgi:hypothetical protein